MNLLRRLWYSFYYLSNPPWDTGITPPEVEDYVRSHPPGRALDLGCGTGTNTNYLARHGWQATGIDFVPRAIRLARRKARNLGEDVDFLIGDVTQEILKNDEFDLVLDIGCLHNLSETNRQRYFENLDRLLAPQGTFLLYGFLRDDQMRNPTGGGLSTSDLNQLGSFLELIASQEGSDRGRPSAWFTFQRSIHRS